MPLGFWNDPDGAKYRAAYFGRFPGVWHHGDFAEKTASGGFIIHGRSDATLNPGGVRIGTAEIYAVVETVPEIAEAIAVGKEADGDVAVILFVRLRDGAVLDAALEKRLRDAIRSGARRAMCRRGSSPPRIFRAPLGQDHGARSARSPAWPRGEERRGAGQSRGTGVLPHIETLKLRLAQRTPMPERAFPWACRWRRALNGHRSGRV